MAPQSPAGIVRLANSPYLDANTNQTGHSHMTVYTHGSGATVFATGTIQWPWGLDSWRDDVTGVAVVPAAQQMTRNVLARFAGANAFRDCQFNLDQSSADTANDAGSGVVAMQTHGNCAWTVAANVPWITITSPASGSGSATIAYSFDENLEEARSGTITIADQTFTLSQSSGCHFAVSPASAQAAAQGDSGSIAIATSSGCSWSAASDQPWLTIAGSPAGQGNGSVTYNVAANGGHERSGTITIESHSVTITQADGCVYAISSSSLDVAPAGGSATIIVTTGPNCYWDSSSGDPWITITSSDNGPGGGSASFTVAPNNSGGWRVGTLSIAANLFTVRQGAVGAPTNLVATATSATSVFATWNAVPGAVSYELARSANNSFYFVIGAPPGTSYTDNFLTPDTTYLYEVRAVNGAGDRSAFSAIDAATTVMVTNDPLVAGSTTIRAAHLSELRTGVNAFRSSVGLGARTWTGPATPGTMIRAIQLQELRGALAEALNVLALPLPTFSNVGLAAGSVVRAADFTELRNALK
jgi:hypothetical protein